MADTLGYRCRDGLQMLGKSGQKMKLKHHFSRQHRPTSSGINQFYMANQLIKLINQQTIFHSYLTIVQTTANMVIVLSIWVTGTCCCYEGNSTFFSSLSVNTARDELSKLQRIAVSTSVILILSRSMFLWHRCNDRKPFRSSNEIKVSL